jgi:hypothetical protein
MNYSEGFELKEGAKKLRFLIADLAGFSMEVRS